MRKRKTSSKEKDSRVNGKKKDAIKKTYATKRQAFHSLTRRKPGAFGGAGPKEGRRKSSRLQRDAFLATTQAQINEPDSVRDHQVMPLTCLFRLSDPLPFSLGYLVMFEIDDAPSIIRFEAPSNLRLPRDPAQTLATTPRRKEKRNIKEEGIKKGGVGDQV